MMVGKSAWRPFYFLFCTVAVLLANGGVRADGNIGEHVQHLKEHIDEYTAEVVDLNKKVEDMVETYEAEGLEAADPARLVDYWEAVKVHGAIETNQVVIYASIWQGLYGVRQAMEDGEPVEVVRERQQELSHALWQAIGAVKLAAEYQAGNMQPPSGAGARQEKEHQEAGPAATIDDIDGKLDRIVTLYGKGEVQQATDLVHDTYLHRFEGIEGMLIEQDASLVEDLEKDFNVTLPKALQDDAGESRVREIADAMQRKLATARELLVEAEKNREEVF